MSLRKYYRNNIIKNKMRKVAFFLVALVFVGCVSAKIITTSQSDVDRVASKFPDYSLTELNNGKTLFEKHCGICHGLKDPTSRTEAQWTKIVPPMSAKVNYKEGKVLDANAEKLILRYLITMSTAKPSK
jgi:hypothetical protein